MSLICRFQSGSLVLKIVAAAQHFELNDLMCSIVSSISARIGWYRIDGVGVLFSSGLQGQLSVTKVWITPVRNAHLTKFDSSCFCRRYVYIWTYIPHRNFRLIDLPSYRLILPFSADWRLTVSVSVKSSICTYARPFHQSYHPTTHCLPSRSRHLSLSPRLLILM